MSIRAYGLPHAIAFKAKRFFRLERRSCDYGSTSPVAAERPPAAPTPAAMLALGEEGIAGHIRKVGLYRAKARNVAALSRILVERHSGQVPRTREELEALPGVGQKTAGVVLHEAFGEGTIPVD